MSFYKTVFWGVSFATVTCCFLILDSSDEVCDDTSKCNLLQCIILYNLLIFGKSAVINIFQMTNANYCVSKQKSRFSVQKRPVDFKGTIQNVYGCGFHMAVTFRRLSPTEFWCDIKEEYPVI